MVANGTNGDKKLERKITGSQVRGRPKIRRLQVVWDSARGMVPFTLNLSAARSDVSCAFPLISQWFLVLTRWEWFSLIHPSHLPKSYSFPVNVFHFSLSKISTSPGRTEQKDSHGQGPTCPSHFTLTHLFFPGPPNQVVKLCWLLCTHGGHSSALSPWWAAPQSSGSKLSCPNSANRVWQVPMLSSLSPYVCLVQ